MEVLSHAEKRRQFDSVDPYYIELEESAPTPQKASDFFEEMGAVFSREARFSRVQPVPILGGVDDAKELVESFYDFW
jgi:DnaJ family protein C protein 2